MKLTLCFAAFLLSVIYAQGIVYTCPAVPELQLPQGEENDQEVFPCTAPLEGGVYYVCLNGNWVELNNCQCPGEVDEYGFVWTGAKVGYAETHIDQQNAKILRYCEATGWGRYDGSLAPKCPAVGTVGETVRGSIMNTCQGEGARNMLCNMKGQWVYQDGDCFCAASGVWDKTKEETLATKNCGSQSQTRWCGARGIWADPDNSKCFCDYDADFYHVPYGSWHTSHRCENGAIIKRYCDENGILGDFEYTGTCMCTSNLVSQIGTVGDKIVKRCAQGSQVTVCTEMGKWVITENDCGCPEDGIWPMTGFGQTHTIEAENGLTLVRKCSAAGVWEAVQDNGGGCPSSGIFNPQSVDENGKIKDTEPGTWGRGGCGSGFVERYCDANGRWTDQYNRDSCYCHAMDEWPVTFHDQVAEVKCGHGKKTRKCNDVGLWEDVDDSDCYCAPMDNFPATPLGKDVSISCYDEDGAQSSSGSQTRSCLRDGTWGPPNQQQCSTKWCPSEQSWYKVPVSHVPVEVTIGCMSGVRTRVCDINGNWGDVTVDECYCTYLENKDDEDETLLDPGQSYQDQCDLGEKVYTCNLKSGYFDPVDLSNCFCGASVDVPFVGRFAQTQAGHMCSAACEKGTSTRMCNYDGFWEDVNNSNCWCEKDHPWEETLAERTVEIGCDLGYRVRKCNAKGSWDPVIENDCMCLNEDLDLTIDQGTSHIIPCDEGDIRYECRADGYFDPRDDSTCFCSSTMEYGIFWNRVKPGHTSTMYTCMNGYAVRRMCGAETGRWEPISKSCRCSHDFDWPSISIGEVATLPCDGHRTGTMQRECYGFSWGTVDDSTCRDDCYYDNGDGTSGYVPIGETVDFECWENFTGYDRQICEYNSVTHTSELKSVEYTCHVESCATDDPNVIVNVGDYDEEEDCPEGYEGTRRRKCLQGGVFGDYDMSDCTVIMCSDNFVHDGLVFNAAPAGKMGKGECREGYSGYSQLPCGPDAEWDTSVPVDESRCVRNMCEPEDGWPATDSMESATKLCPMHYTGDWERLCQADGTWEPITTVPATCVPISPVYRTMPFDGMTHVSRAPSANLLTSVAVDIGLNNALDCEVLVVSVADPTEKYKLTVNMTRTNMVGYYGNGGVFTDFVLDEDQDVYDPANYLSYGAYEVTFPACYKTVTDLDVSKEDIVVRFTTTPVPPSAPQNIEVVYAAGGFQVKFDEPAYVDEEYPVTSYYLTFQPPVYPEQRIPAGSLSFGPLAYVPGDVTLFVHAENAYGLSSPDFAVQYSFDGALQSNDGDQILASILQAPILSVRYVDAYDTMAYVGFEAVAPVSLQAFLRSHDIKIQCNDKLENLEQNELRGHQIPVTLQYSTPASVDFSMTCNYKIGSINGPQAMLKVDASSLDAIPGSQEPSIAAPINLKAEEVWAGFLKLSWDRPPATKSEKIQAYFYDCQDVHGMVTSESVTFNVLGVTTANSAGDCTVQASKLATGKSSEARVATISTPDLHRVSAADIEAVISPFATFVEVSITAGYTIRAECALYTMDKSQKLSETIPSDGNRVVFPHLEPSTAYLVQCSYPEFPGLLTSEPVMTPKVLPISDVENAQEFGKDLFTVIEPAENGVTSQSAMIRVKTLYPEFVYCFSHPTTELVDPAIVLTQMHGGMFDSKMMEVALDEEATIVLSNLHPNTEYYITCVGREAQKVQRSATAFTTPYPTDSAIRVVRVEKVEGVSRLGVLKFAMNAPVELGTHPFVNLSCGGMNFQKKLNERDLSADRLELTVPLLEDLSPLLAITQLPEGTRCYVSFAALDSLRILNFFDNNHLMLAPKPFTVDGVESSALSFTTSSDCEGPRGSLVTFPIVEDTGVKVALVTEEPILFVSDAKYNVYCDNGSNPELHEEFAVKDYPVETSVSYKKGTPEYYLTFSTGTLPRSKNCQVVVDSGSAMDSDGNALKCITNDLCTFAFTSSATSKFELLSIYPPNGAKNVPLDATVTITFNMEVVPPKFMFIDQQSGRTVVTGSSCINKICTVSPGSSAWAPGATYAMKVDSGYVKALNDDQEIAMPFYSFTLGTPQCSMDYITKEWDQLCTCVNAVNHCRCDCGPTAIMRLY